MRGTGSGVVLQSARDETWPPAGVMATGLACLAEDQNTAAKADAKRQTMQIQANKIEYNAETKEITASGNVVIANKDGSAVKGEKVVINPDENALLVSGGAKIEVKSDGKKEDVRQPSEPSNAGWRA